MSFFLSDQQLAKKFGVARPTIWGWIKKYGFPQPVKLSPGVTRWKATDVERWISEREGAA